MFKKAIKKATNIKKLFIGLKPRMAMLFASMFFLIVAALIWFVFLREGQPTVDESVDTQEEQLSATELERAGDYAAAADSYEKEAAESDDEMLAPTLYEQAGDFYNRTGQYEKAIGSYEKAIESYQVIDDNVGASRCKSKIETTKSDMSNVRENQNEEG